MIKVAKKDYTKLKTICSSYKNEIMLLWFLDGNPSCDAWIDNLEQPEEAVIIAADFCYLLGKIKQAPELKI